MGEHAEGELRLEVARRRSAEQRSDELNEKVNELTKRVGQLQSAPGNNAQETAGKAVGSNAPPPFDGDGVPPLVSPSSAVSSIDGASPTASSAAAEAELKR